MSGSTGNKFFVAILEHAIGKPIHLKSTEFKSGGCINNTLKLITNHGDYFLKWQSGIPEDMFQKEADGLKLLARAGNIKIPEVIGYGIIEGKHYLLMENIESTPPLRDYWKNFGVTLAEMHRNNSDEKYGLDHDNYIGKLPQSNERHENWMKFFIQKRLEVQLKLAIENRMVSSSFVEKYRRFYNLLPELLPVDKPALIHGDMWSGNVMVGSDGKVCLIDPAVYYGHREIELAFTHMFGGFDRDFYDAYKSSYPLEPGFEERISIYNMYPSMVHVNLFGQSYLGGVESVLRKYL